jgi:hypothetical protein
MYRTVSRSLTPATLLAGASFSAFLAGNTALAQTFATRIEYDQPGVTIPASYGAEYDIALGSGQMEVPTSNARGTPTLDLGQGNSNYYVYKLGYIYQANARRSLTLATSSAGANLPVSPITASQNTTIGGTTGVVTTMGGATGTSGGRTAITGGTTGSGTETCTPGNHGLVRGRPHLANGTLVAENGCPLRGVHTHTIPQTYFSQWYGSLSWWQNLHDIGHFNLVSAGGYLGEWNNSTDPDQIQTVEGQEAVLDQIVSLAKESGMYVIIHFDAFNSSDYWSSAHTFWTAIAPRYAHNINVIYEIVNEPELYDSANIYLWVIRKIRQKLFSERANDIPEQMQSLYNLIRRKAPDTPIILWSFSYVTDTDNKLSIISQANGVDYSNAVVGYHGYGANTVGPVDSAALQIQGAGYPIMMTEVDGEVSTGCRCAVGFAYIFKLELEKISWVWLGGDGFCNADNGAAYGNCTNPISVTWPKD